MTALVLPAEELQPVDWRTIDDACLAWLEDVMGSRVQSGGFIWENQKIAQPPYPYLSLLRDTEIDEGGADEIRRRTVDVDGKILGVDPTAGPADTNEEIAIQPIVWTLAIQAHANPDGGGNDPGCNPMQLLGRIKRSLGQTTTIDRLRVAGVSIVNKSQITDLSLVINGDWTSRASFDVSLRTASVMAEKIAFIDKVQVTSSALGVDLTVDAS